MIKELGVVDGAKATGISGLTVDQYDTYMLQRQELTDFQNDQQLYTMVKWNYNDFYKSLDYYLSKYKQELYMNWIKMDEMMLDLNRYLLNYLTAFRTFLDHSETNLKKKYGKDSSQVKNFKGICSMSMMKTFHIDFFIS